MCFESSKLEGIKKQQSRRQQNQKFLKQTKFLSKHFAENGKKKFFPNDYSFTNNLKNAKTNTIMAI